jgi:hypothetical protein
MPEDSCPSVTHDLSSPRGDAAVDNEGNSVYVANNNALVGQTLRDIPSAEEFLAATRSLPYEPHHLYRNQPKLDWERGETVAFLDRTLRKDPRMKPEDVIIDHAHLNYCTSCGHDEGLHGVLHGEATIDIGNRTQPLVDDWPIHSWQNVVRFLNGPQEKRPLVLDDHADSRFGCPCGNVPTPDGGVKLYYSGGPSLERGPDEATGYKNKYVSRISTDGVSGWTEEGKVEIHDREYLGTFTPTDTKSLKPSNDLERFDTLPVLAGYEDKHGGACLAFGYNGQKFFNLGNDHDSEDEGLNDYCLENSNDYLGRAGDTYVQPVVDHKRQKEYVWYRQDFGEEGGWREVRGMQVVTLNSRFADVQRNLERTRVEDQKASWYFDRLGKLEHYRRHVYCITLTQYSEDLWYGLMTVIEWQKDLLEEIGPHKPPFERDTLNVYLVTSRDGVHVDHEWVYAHQPLLPKDGLKQSDWDSGLIMQSAQFMTRGNEHRTYYEARPGHIHHENRFEDNLAKIATASWELDRVVGLRAAHSDAPGVITTKRFRLQSGSRSGKSSIRINVDIPDAACESRVLAEVLIAGENGASDTVAPGLAIASSVPVILSSSHIELQWGADRRYLGELMAERTLIRLRFHVHGAAKLYAFQVVPMQDPMPGSHPSSPQSASPSVGRPHSRPPPPPPQPLPPYGTPLAPPLSPSWPSPLSVAPPTRAIHPSPSPSMANALQGAASSRIGLGIALIALSMATFFYACKLFWKPTTPARKTNKVVDASIEIPEAAASVSSPPAAATATRDDLQEDAKTASGGYHASASKNKKKKGYAQFDDDDDL